MHKFLACVVVGGLVNPVYYKFLFEIPQGHNLCVLPQSCCGMTGFDYDTILQCV